MAEASFEHESSQPRVVLSAVAPHWLDKKTYDIFVLAVCAVVQSVLFNLMMIAFITGIFLHLVIQQPSI